MRSLKVLLFLAALPLSAVRVNAAAVEGVVTNAVTGAPVARAHVVFQGRIDGQPGSYGAMTGPDGRFSIPNMDAGRYTGRADRVGFVAPRRSVPLQLKADDRQTDVEVQLIPTGTISGRVTNPDGDPVEGAGVYAEGQGSRVSISTDDRGAFRIAGLEPGRYRVGVRFEELWGTRPEIRSDGTVDEHYADALYGSPVVVPPGGESGGIDIRLVRVPFVRVSGKVVGVPSGVAAQITVWHDRTGAGRTMKPDHTFELWRLNPGHYRIAAQFRAANGDEVRTPPVDIDVAGSNIDGIVLRPVPASKMEGRVIFEDEGARPGEGNSDRVVLLEPADDDAWDGSVSAPVAADGTFRLEKVSPERYRVRVSWEEGYVRSLSVGPVLIDGPVLDLRQGASASELTVTVARAASSLSGKVDKAENAAVVLTGSAADPGFQPRIVMVNPDGSYAIGHIPPGKYLVVAMEQGSIQFDDGIPAGFENMMETVEVGAGDKVVKDLKFRVP